LSILGAGCRVRRSLRLALFGGELRQISLQVLRRPRSTFEPEHLQGGALVRDRAEVGLDRWNGRALLERAGAALKFAPRELHQQV